MPLYIVVGVDHYPHSLARRDALRQAHFDYVTGDDSAIRFVGPMRNEDDDSIAGSVYFIEAENAASIQTWLDQEPYFKGGVYKDMIIKPFEIRKNELPLKESQKLSGPSAGRRP